MHKLVYTAFKTIFLSMMFIFLFDMFFYVYRAFSVNQRMETIMASMQKVVMDNNYLPNGEYVLYNKMFQHLAYDMNSGDLFIAGIGTNYGKDANGASMDYFKSHQEIATGSFSDRLIYRMDKPAKYGDVMVVQAKVQITQPVWGFLRGSETPLDASTEFTATYPDYNGQDSTYWNRIGYKRTTLYYNYYVPCLKFQSIQT